MRERFAETIERNALFLANAFGIIAAEAAYNHGEPWLEAVMDYVEDNYRFMKAYLAEHLPQLKIIRPEGTYLVWVDCRELGMDPAARKEMMMEQARVNLDEGELFGVLIAVSCDLSSKNTAICWKGIPERVRGG